MTDHAVLAPSSAFRRRLCAGSLEMEARYPQQGDTEDSRNGTAAHHLGAELINAYARAGIGKLQLENQIGKEAPNGVIITEEMFEAADMYASDVADLMIKICAFNPAIESTVAAKAIHDECWGTPDCSLHHASERTVYIWDFKYGRRIVEQFENWQMIEYAAGIYAPGMFERFVLTIVQPRAFHRDGSIRRWIITATELEKYIAEAAGFETKALSPDAMCSPDGAACRDCNARHACESLQHANYDIMDFLGKPTPVELSPEALSIELRAIRKAEKLLQARKTGLEAQVEGIIQTGKSVPGFKLEASVGNLTWRPEVSVEEVFALGDMFGKDLRKPLAPITPTQAKNLGIDVSVINGYAHKPKTGMKLVDDSTEALRVFGKDDDAQ